jgi:two-component sensor histidine kinase
VKTFDPPPSPSGPQPLLGTVAGIVLACVISALAVLGRFALEGTLPAGYPFLTFFPAVIITSFLCGTAAGTLCALLCGLAAWYWFIPPDGLALDRQSAFALGFYVFIVAVDIVLIHLMTRAMRRLEAEKRLSNALAEQQRTMFEELQHRVANNMAFVASLLNMSRRRLAADPAAAPAILDDARNRIETMARIHRRLHDPNQVDLPVRGYLQDLCADVVETSGLSGVTCAVDVPEMSFDIRKLTTISMLVSEVVTNSLKHAYPDGRSGRITVSLRRLDGGEAELTIADDGVGLPKMPDDASPGHGLGNRIVEALAKQLKGSVSRQSNPGLATRIVFPL